MTELLDHGAELFDLHDQSWTAACALAGLGLWFSR